MDRVDVPSWAWWAAPAAIVFGFILGSIGTILVDVLGGAGGSSVSHPTAVVSIIGDIVFDLCFVVAALVMVSAAGGGFGSRRFAGGGAGWLPSPAEFGFRRAHLRNAIVTFVLASIVYYVVTDIYALVVQPARQGQAPVGAERYAQPRGDRDDGRVRVCGRADLRGVLLPRLPIRHAAQDAGDGRRP